MLECVESLTEAASRQKIVRNTIGMILTDSVPTQRPAAFGLGWPWIRHALRIIKTATCAFEMRAVPAAFTSV